MCQHKIVGDFYRGCGHFHGDYYTGDVVDCMSEFCKSSQAHKHKTARNCGCPEVVTDDAKIRNMFRTSHENCRPPDDVAHKQSSSVHGRRTR